MSQLLLTNAGGCGGGVAPAKVLLWDSSSTDYLLWDSNPADFLIWE